MKVPFFDLHHQYQTIKDEIQRRVFEVLDSCSYIEGPYVRQFEEEIGNYLQTGNAIGCSSGTEALILALRACNVRPGDEVITTPFSFFATAEAIASIGAVPVFVDINIHDYLIDPSKIEEAISDKTKVVMPVHIFGAVCDMDKISDIAHKYNIKTIEDAAQAIGSEYKGKKAGTLGDIGCFSFYPTKNLGGCGDGGMVATDNTDYATIVRALKNHGAGEDGARASELLGGVSGPIEQISEKSTELYNPLKYYNYLIGYNSRLDAIQASILSVKLAHIEEYNSKRTHIASLYKDGLTPQVICPVYSENTKSCWHQFVVRSQYKRELCEYLVDHEIGCGTFYPVPLHKQKAFAGNNKITQKDLPIAEQLSQQSVCLPIFPEMTDEQVQYVIDTINLFYKEKA